MAKKEQEKIETGSEEDKVNDKEEANEESDLDYEKIGLKSGLEIHQQIDSGKLFCRCPGYLRTDKPDFEIKRKSFEEKRKEELKTKIASWVPKTKLGKKVKSGEIKEIDYILDNNLKILESEIVDSLLEVKSDLILIGQSKGKFGGGKRRAWRQTQRKTKEGNIPTFSALAIVGDENGHVGVGTGKAKETLPARDKAMRKAKLEIIKTKRDCASFYCSCGQPHSLPFKVEGKAGSARRKGERQRIEKD